jgi:uncharacterized protein (DUF362 family)
VFHAYLDRIGDDLSSHLQSGLQFIHWEALVKPGATVFIKPNMTWPEPRPGVTTSPRFLDALLPVLKSRAGRLIVGESDGGTFSAEEAITRLGLLDICHRHGAEFVNLSHQPRTMLRDRIAGREIRIEASQFLIDEVDVFITLPVLKTHVVTGVTLGLKNQWGCIPDPMRLLYHHILDWGIVALNRAYKPRIAILDGTYAMDRRGPLEGDPIPAGWLVVSDNVVVLDAIGCHLLDVPARRVRHIRFAEAQRLGTTYLNQVRLNRDLPEPAIHSVLQPNRMDRIAIILYRSWLLSKLVFDSPLTPVLYKLIRRTPPGTFEPFHHATFAHPAGD